MVKIYNVLIVGAGRIGAFFDTPDSEGIFTHAHAFFSLPQFKIVGFVDTNKNVAEMACKIWGGASFDSLDQAFAHCQVDVVCVTSPDESHYSILIDLLCRPIKLIFAEKPLTQNLLQAKHVLDLGKNKNIPILVNYTRRFIPEFVELKGQIQLGNFGDLLTGFGIYGKGVLHNGSHLIDILRYLCGEVAFIKLIDYCYDFYQSEPSVSAVLKINNVANFVLNYADCSKYTVFEIDLFFEKARIKITDLGFKIKIHKIENSKIFSGYKTLAAAEILETQYQKALLFAAQHILNILNSGTVLCCSAQDAYFAMNVCLKMLEQVKSYEDKKNTFASL